MGNTGLGRGLEFHPNQLLDSLNGKRDFVEAHRIYAMLGTGRGPNEDESRAAEVFVAVLRSLVDAWLDSGLDASGMESPRERKIVAKEPFKSLQAWLLANPPAPMLTHSGEVKMELRTVKNKPWAGMINAAFDEARILFLLLMTSAAKYALFRCSHAGCGVYYFLHKPRRLYKQGSVCPAHRTQQGTLRQRKQNQTEALQVAAAALAVWPKLSDSTRSKHKSDRGFITSKIKRFGFGSKWVSRNMTTIRESAR